MKRTVENHPRLPASLVPALFLAATALVNTACANPDPPTAAMSSVQRSQPPAFFRRGGYAWHCRCSFQIFVVGLSAHPPDRLLVRRLPFILELGFKLLGKGFAEMLLERTANPLVGLFVGILATSLIQSSSTTTSMTVALVAVGGLTIEGVNPLSHLL